MIFNYLIILMFFSYGFAAGESMSMVMLDNDKDELKGTDFDITWSFLYQKNGERRYLHALDIRNIGDKALGGQEWALYFNLIHRIKLETVSPVVNLDQHEMIRLDDFKNGIAYRILPPGAVIEDGILKANSAYPGLEIRFTRDGLDPVPNSELYKSPVSVKGTIKLRTFNSIGRGSRVTIVSE